MNVLLFFSVTIAQPGSKMVTSAKSAVPTVANQAAAMQLGQCAKNLATCLAELRTATLKVSIYCQRYCSRSLLTDAGNVLPSLVRCRALQLI